MFIHYDFNGMFCDDDKSRVPRLTFFVDWHKGVDWPPRYNHNLERIRHHTFSVGICLFRYYASFEVRHTPFRYALEEEGSVEPGKLIWRKKLKKVYL